MTSSARTIWTGIGRSYPVPSRTTPAMASGTARYTPTARGNARTRRACSSDPASTRKASTESTTTSPIVPGTCFDWIAARVSAVKAAMSPNGMNITRVTVKISTVPSATST